MKLYITFLILKFVVLEGVFSQSDTPPPLPFLLTLTSVNLRGDGGFNQTGFL